jgi:small subunit ribosomal protein S9
MPRTKIHKDYIQTVGRRKSAVARVRLYPTLRKVSIKEIELSKGEVSVNDLVIKDYFGFDAYYPKFYKFLKEMGVEGKFIFTVKAAGGGKSGQLDAMIHGIARALDKQDTDAYHDLLKDGGYLTRDARVRERRKVGMGGKARRKRQSPKR